MVKSFLKYTKDPKDASFVILLLEGFVRILKHDNGIKFFIESGVVERMNELLKDQGKANFDQ